MGDLNKKNVIVTGADGFIGSHLVEALLEQGCNVKALALYNSFNSWGWLDSLPSGRLNDIEVITGDVRDPFCMSHVIKDADIVFHLAALIAIPFSYHAPQAYVETNITGTLNVLQACRDHDVERVLVTSTSEVYGTAQYVPIDEAHPYQGQSPYSATKIGADRLAESYYKSFDLPVTIVRPFNTYGPRQSARAFIPTVITQLLAGNQELKLGSLEPTRDLNYVRDTVRGFIEIAKAEAAIGEEINIASQSEVSMGDVLREILDLLQIEAKAVRDAQRVRPDKSEVQRLFGSNSKIKELTDWTPRISLRDGLSNTIDWFRENAGRYKANLYNI